MNDIEESPTPLYELKLDPTANAPGDARRFVARVLNDHGAVEAATLVISELVTNAVLHGGADAGDVIVVIRHDRSAERVRLEVSQPKHPGFLYSDRAPGHLEPTGRGLMIVDAVAADWGIDDDTGSVWAIVA